jgi:hypothetical protein
MDEAEADVLACMAFPAARRAIERQQTLDPIREATAARRRRRAALGRPARAARRPALGPAQRGPGGEIKRRTDVVGLRGLTRPSATLPLAPQRGRHHPPGRRAAARAERRTGRAAGPLHDP